MTKRLIHCSSVLITLLALSIGIAQAQTANARANDTASQAESNSGFQIPAFPAQARRSTRWSFGLMPSNSGARASASLFNIVPLAAGPNLPVFGGGTLGRPTKGTGFTSSNSFASATSIFDD